MADDSPIIHVSDTALWVATFRAQEGQRADAAFDDPLASILTGERGRQIARAIPRAAMVAWGMVMRTSAIDRLIDEAVTAGIDTVLNLGAGLDTRPYRMKLPAALRWIEIDFQNIVELKNSKLSQYKPVCQLERIGMDLLDSRSRKEMFARYEATSKNTLVISEGVISYFSTHDAASLASELHAIPSIRFWIQDFDNAGHRREPWGWKKRLKAAPFLFKVKNWFEFFNYYGWQPSKVITNFEQSERINRPYPFDFPFGLIMRALPREMSQKILSLSGAVLMKKCRVL
jgi:methyltransferase (TIGR00027 family)